MTVPAADAAGWEARLELGLVLKDGRTVLRDLRHQGPLRVQRPFYPEGGPAHLYLLHPPGGVVGGDRLEIEVRVADGAHALLTTPGATKFYRSAGPQSVQVQRLRVATGGILEWFPQESILFPGAHLRLATEIDLDPGARFLGWEVTSLGRPAIGERFAQGRADLSLAVRRAGLPLLLERLRVCDGDCLDGAAGLRGHPVTGTLLAVGANAADLEALRADAPATSEPQVGAPPRVWAATLIDDLLVCRALATGTEPVQRLFSVLWGILRPRLLNRPACPPRIWAT